jgi:hypothetical protein
MESSNNSFMNRWVDISDVENKRTYVYPNGIELNVDGVVSFHAKVSFSGLGVAHRLICKDGKRVYVQPGWIAILIDGKFLDETID